ncbi:MAG: AAA family ATPase [Candidatus Phytoplasma stylosanthis]|uniref:AAA family ATPase n=1 Tax=Candidatus Phytoplasma stylosanthis TaxID=2798314 RepID=UPI00293958CA|nr:AAA family ATPase [Candidatus Phytoplasma stylosanthis]MDV3167919.1 AAA family ATPase [Candidatus Phytoplasma stylosanthis]MDV3170754.1 AAA family ATPase [Candidatus Phytoplasma stylosanthis]MDV3174011.1 AAA family ATPase [Candidatus Phytoplasma stylosanthis]
MSENYIFNDPDKKNIQNPNKESRNSFYFSGSLKQKLRLAIDILFILVLFATLLLSYAQYKNNKNLNNFPKNINDSWAKDKQVQFKKKDIVTIEEDFHGNKSNKKRIEELIYNVKKNNIKDIPRGILLHGAPGTGKTYLAKCLAGSVKDNAPVFIVNGSQFIEMYVGLGPLRVREIFAYARQTAKNKEQKFFFIFIDEIDSISRERSSRLDSNNIEHENALNALLSEIDGFNTNSEPYGIVIGATNREQIIDPALKREGRLSENLYLDFLNEKAIEELFKYFLKKYVKDDNKLNNKSEEIFKILQQENKDEYNLLLFTLSENKSTPSDIHNLIKKFLNIYEKEKEKSNLVSYIYDAWDDLKLGPSIEQNDTNEYEKEKVIIHELGHALIAQELGFKIIRINIGTRGKIAGYTISVPKEKIFLPTYEYFENKIKILLGGTIAEEIFLENKKQVTSGAQDDLFKAKELAKIIIETGLYGLYSKNDEREIYIHKEDKERNIVLILKESYKKTKELLNGYNVEKDENNKEEKDKKQIWQKLKDHLKQNSKINGTEFEKIYYGKN